MRNFITILIVLALSFIMYTPAHAGFQSNIKRNIQQQLAPPVEGPEQPFMTSFCKRQIAKYGIRIAKLRAKDNPSVSERWSLGYNKDRLEYWTEYCNTGVDPDSEE